MIIPDVNLLLYAYNIRVPQHLKAKAWWERCLSGEELVGLAPAVVFGFVRMATNASVFPEPRTVSDVVGTVESWLAQPVVSLLRLGDDHVEKTFSLLKETGAAANLVTDCQLAAIAKEYGGIVHTNDTDFARFKEVRWINPLAE